MDKYDINDLHRKMLEMIKDFDEFCASHDIKYYLMGGSALGAIRHSGFIPWDDDFDVFMEPDDYNKLVALSNQFSKKYYFQRECSKECPIMYAKLKMNGTTFIEIADIDNSIHQGIFIDIFCLHNAPNSFFKKKIQFYLAKLLIAECLYKNHYKAKTLLKKIQVLSGHILCSIFGFDKIYRKVKKYDKYNTKEVTHLFGKAKFKSTHFSREFLGVPRCVKFENLNLPVPERVENYLTIVYGNYSVQPSQDKINNSVHSIYFNPSIDYRDYLREKFDKNNK